MRINCKIHEIWKIRLQIKSFYYFHNLFALKSWAGSLNLNVCIIKWGLYFSHIAVKNKKSNICEVLAAQSCLTFCHPMDCSLPGSSVHRLLQARNLKWVAIPFFRGSSWPRDQTQVLWIAGRFFTFWCTAEAPTYVKVPRKLVAITIVFGMLLLSLLWDTDKSVGVTVISFISEYTLLNFLLLVFNLKWTQ